MKCHTFNILFCASVLQKLICSLLLLTNLAILWDLLIQITVKLWCTLSTHMWTQQPSDFQRMIGEEFRSYTVNSWWDLIFKIKPTGYRFHCSPWLQGPCYITKKKEEGQTWEKHMPVCSIYYVPSLLCPHCNQEVMEQQFSGLVHCLPAHLHIAKQILWTLLCKSAVSVSGATGREMRDTVALTKSMRQFSEGRNYSAIGVEHNQNWPQGVNFAKLAFF